MTQPKQLVAPELIMKVPTAQLEQKDDEIAPVDNEYVPAVQPVHNEEPVNDAKAPAGQLEQDDKVAAPVTER